MRVCACFALVIQGHPSPRTPTQSILMDFFGDTFLKWVGGLSVLVSNIFQIATHVACSPPPTVPLQISFVHVCCEKSSLPMLHISDCFAALCDELQWRVFHGGG